MKYLIKKSDGSVSILIQNIAEMDIEQEIAKWSEEDKRLVTGYRAITDEDLPLTREFRDAWCDVTDSPRVDIDLNKAKHIQLAALRLKRDVLLKKSDIDYMVSSELGDAESVSKIKIKRQSLRDATEPLKNLIVEGFNDETVLAEIKKLGDLNPALL